jgi:hypothetical protein
MKSVAMNYRLTEHVPDMARERGISKESLEEVLPSNRG